MFRQGIHLAVQLTTATAENFNSGTPLPIFFTVLGYLAEGRYDKFAVTQTVHPEVTTATSVFSLHRSFPKSYIPGMHIHVCTVGSGL